MKNIIKMFGVLFVVLGIFAAVRFVSASDAELLQPADEVVYGEDVTINATLRTDSIYVGEEGVGGVTFFNGSIVNIGATTPVTIADDLRVDGEIWRMQKNGAHPLKVSDNLVPTTTNTSDLGSSSNRWGSLFVQNGDYSGEINVAGDVRQDIGSHGAVKALVYVNSNGTCAREWTFDGSDIACGKYSPINGIYNVNFEFDISNSFYQVTTNNILGYSATGDIINANRINVYTVDVQRDPTPTNDSAFMMTIY